MAIDLMALEPQKISKNLKGKFAMIYGDPGCGKTTLASKFDKSLIAAFEMGSNALNNVYVQPIKTWKDWKSVVSQLIKKPELQEKFDTIAIDTADEAFKLCEKWSCEQFGVETVKEIASYGGGYKIVDDNFISTFRELAYAGYGLLFISHSTEKEYTNDKGEAYNKIVPALPNRAFNLINKMVDLIGYIREIPIEKEGEIERKRYVFFRGDERFLAKSRFKYITPKVELTYDDYVNAIYDAIDAEIAHSGGEATNEENPFLVRNFDELMEEARAIWGQVVSRDLVSKAAEILKEEFGKETKFSEILPEQKDQLAKVLFEVKSIL